MVTRVIALGLLLAACAPGGFAYHTGQLYCAFETATGGQITAALIAAGTQGNIYATGATKAFVEAACAQAAANIGAQAGVPVSPPPDAAAVPPVAIDPSLIGKDEP